MPTEVAYQYTFFCKDFVSWAYWRIIKQFYQAQKLTSAVDRPSSNWRSKANNVDIYTSVLNLIYIKLEIKKAYCLVGLTS